MLRPGCLLHAMVFAVMVAWAPTVFGGSCAENERLLAGSWEQVSHAGAFEQMELAVEDGRRIFNSWLHERPEITEGHWSLKGCTLEVRAPSDPALSYTFTVISADGKRLILREASEPGVARYRRIAP